MHNAAGDDNSILTALATAVNLAVPYARYDTPPPARGGGGGGGALSSLVHPHPTYGHTSIHTHAHMVVHPFTHTHLWSYIHIKPPLLACFIQSHLSHHLDKKPLTFLRLRDLGWEPKVERRER